MQARLLGELIMSLFISTLNQMGVLGFYMIIGFVIAKLGIVDRKSTTLLSKLENNVFLPALVLYTFIENFIRLTIVDKFGKKSMDSCLF